VHPLTVPLIQPLLEHFFCPGRQVSLAFLYFLEKLLQFPVAAPFSVVQILYTGLTTL
jgi:hypothetical protein